MPIQLSVITVAMYNMHVPSPCYCFFNDDLLYLIWLFIFLHMVFQRAFSISSSNFPAGYLRETCTGSRIMYDVDYEIKICHTMSCDTAFIYFPHWKIATFPINIPVSYTGLQVHTNLRRIPRSLIGSHCSLPIYCEWYRYHSDGVLNHA